MARQSNTLPWLIRFTLALVIFQLGSHVAAADAASDLLGNWRMVEATWYYEDGSHLQTQPKCRVNYSENQISTACDTANGKRQSTNSFRLLSPGRYEVLQRDVNDQNKPVVLRSEVTYRIQDGVLHLVAYPDPPPSNFHRKNFRQPKSVESVSFRE